MKTEELIKFYVENGTDKTVQMLKENSNDWILRYILHFDKNANGWTKRVAEHLLLEYRK